MLETPIGSLSKFTGTGETELGSNEGSGETIWATGVDSKD